MKLRLLITASITIFLFYSCKQNDTGAEQTSTYKIYGKTTFNVTKPVFLQEIIGNNLRSMDSANITGSTFTFTGKLNEPNFYRVEIKDGGSYIFPLDTAAAFIEISGSAEMPVFKVTGSPLNDDFQKIYDLRVKAKQQFDSLNQAYILAENMQNPMQVDLIKSNLATLEKTLNTRIKELINTSRKSIVSVYAASLLDVKTNEGFLDSLAVVLAPLAKNSFTINSFVETIQKARKAKPGSKAPDFIGNTPDGKKVSLADYKGKVVLLDFWASWCGPCRRESPNLVRIYNKFKGRNFDVLGISLDTEADKWKDAIADDHLSWQHISDLKGWDSEFGGLFNIEAIPQTFLIDKEGKIIAWNLQGEDLEKKLEEILN